MPSVVMSGVVVSDRLDWRHWRRAVSTSEVLEKCDACEQRAERSSIGGEFSGGAYVSAMHAQLSCLSGCASVVADKWIPDVHRRARLDAGDKKTPTSLPHADY